MRTWRGRADDLDLTSDSHVDNAMRLTQSRRRLFNDLIGIRKMRKFSQSQVARAIGINRSGISRFESDVQGSNPTIDVILRYAQAVGASIHMYAEPVERTENRQARAVLRLSLSTPFAKSSFVDSLAMRSHSDFGRAGWVSIPGEGR